MEYYLLNSNGKYLEFNNQTAIKCQQIKILLDIKDLNTVSYLHPFSKQIPEKFQL